MTRDGQGQVFDISRRRVCICALVLLAWPLLAWVAAESLIVTVELPQADALAVLAGSATYVERVRRAAELFHAGQAPIIILTNDGLAGGWSVAEQRNPLFVERAMAELRRAGVPAERIEVVPQPVSSTYDEAVRLREYAAARGLRSLLVVTSAYQSRRARWTFGRVFRGSGVVLGVAVARPGEQSPSAATWWLHGLGWRFVPGEYVKLSYYWAHYS